MKAKCMSCGGSMKKMQTGGTSGKCESGYVWNGNICVPEKKTPGPLSPIGAKVGLGSIALGATGVATKALVNKIKAKKSAKKESNKSIDNAVSAAKKSSIMKKGGSVKKMAVGGAYAPAQKGGDNVSKQIYGIPNAGTTGPNRTAGYEYKKGGTTPKAKFGASVNVQHSPAPGRVRSSSGTGTVPVGMRKKKGGTVKK